MKRIPTELALNEIPVKLHKYIDGAKIYDSSCSREARVYFLDKDEGCYLKCAKKSSLEREAVMTSFFHSIKLGVEVLEYITEDSDWMLTRKAEGEDCTHSDYLSDPKWLSQTLATYLRSLHEIKTDLCPVKNRTAEYLETVRTNYRKGMFDDNLFSDRWQIKNAGEAFVLASEYGKYLKNDVLIHGDYCLPNIMLKDRKPSAFIDVGNGGMADRHIDIFWGVWTLNFNLHTNAYEDYFLDAYGRDGFEYDILKVIAAMECFG